ncbi:hypothetical protein T11_16379 [Trichinella zimbabwensis]|uniref:Uncharacterized protein n=1 Tax=Trichinella zimbabwensis TaxID=268475 RepID=A0A0V1GIR9_9BILA|nr:hypothetical protein T11_16379 [Trichinella zimbabwensis]
MKLRSFVQCFVFCSSLFHLLHAISINLSEDVSNVSSNGNETVLMDTKPVAILIYFRFQHSVKST